jgi:hypothetical protein
MRKKLKCQKLKGGQIMKKSLIAILVLAMFCFASFAYASADMFSDVPSNHWAYGAINQLAKAGVVNGMGDGTFQGNKTMTRYEMASIVANAMTKEDKVDKETRALIDKLALEFANELKSLGQRVDALEKNASPLKIDGFMQEREEYLNHPMLHGVGTANTGTQEFVDTDRKNMQRTVLWLNVTDQFDGDTAFHGVLYSEQFPGVASQNVWLQVHEAEVDKKITPTLTVGAGEMFPTLGDGTLMSTPMMQGGKLMYADDRLKVNLLDVSFNVDYADTSQVLGSQGMNVGNPAPGGFHFYMGDATYSLSKDADIYFSFVDDCGVVMPTANSAYKTWAVGTQLRSIGDFKLTADYAQNNSTVSKFFNGNVAAKAYMLNLKYQGANPFKPGSTGIWAEYKHADPGFDLFSMAGPDGKGMDYWNAPFNYTCGAGGGYADNIKGYEVGVETTVATRLIFTVTYDSLQAVNLNSGPEVLNNKDRSFGAAQLWYLF